MNTWSGLQALAVLGRIDEKKTETAEWLRACQLESGGFTWQPRPEFAGVDDVAYTWAAVRALHLLGSAPQNREACVQWLYSLANGDGGFSDRRGWLSNPMATTMRLMRSNARCAQYDHASKGSGAAPASPRELPSGSARLPHATRGARQRESRRSGRAGARLRIHLWGAKNAGPGWLETGAGDCGRAEKCR